MNLHRDHEADEQGSTAISWLPRLEKYTEPGTINSYPVILEGRWHGFTDCDVSGVRRWRFDNPEQTEEEWSGPEAW